MKNSNQIYSEIVTHPSYNGRNGYSLAKWNVISSISSIYLTISLILILPLMIFGLGLENPILKDMSLIDVCLGILFINFISFNIHKFIRKNKIEEIASGLFSKQAYEEYMDIKTNPNKNTMLGIIDVEKKGNTIIFRKPKRDNIF